MIQYVMLLVYMLAGDLHIEQKTFETSAACQAAGGERATAISQDPRFQGGYFAGCIEVKGKKA